MKPGELRTFNRRMAVRGGVAPIGKPFILLEPVLEEPSFYKRWYILIDGKQDILDEHVLARFTDEVR